MKQHIDTWIKRAAYGCPAVGEVSRFLVGTEVRLGRVVQCVLIGTGRVKIGVQWLNEPPVLRLAA